MLKGRLLVATPPLSDPHFDRTVVLMLEHDEHHALGVVLNRPSDLPISAALPGWETHVREPAVLFIGGPVGDGTGVAVVQLVDGPDIVDLNVDPAELALESPLRIFIGFASWGPAQLESELAVGAWVVADSLPGDLHTASPHRLWRDVLLRQGGETAWLANAPADLSVN
jgi:putative transcriptional regulator